MRISKLIAIIGAVLLFVCFFLPWESMSFMGTEIYYSGYQKAAGSPPGNYKLSVNPSDYGAESDLDYLNQGWGDLLGDSLSGSEIEALSGINDSINRAFAKPILYVFPVTAILLVLFSILSNRKPHISFGIVMVALSISLGIVLFTQGKSMATLMKLGDLAGSAFSFFGMQELVPTSKFEIGFYGTAAGLLAFMVAGFLGWQDYSKEKKESERASFQNQPAYSYPNQYYQQGYPQNPQQNAQPYGRPDGATPPSQDQSVFLYQQNRMQYENYQQSAPTPPQQAPYNAPPVYPNVPQQGYQAPGAYPQAPYYQPQPPAPQPPQPQQPQQPPRPQPPAQPYPQQPHPPQQNPPDKPVAGWRPIYPPKDHQE